MGMFVILLVDDYDISCFLLSHLPNASRMKGGFCHDCKTKKSTNLKYYFFREGNKEERFATKSRDKIIYVGFEGTSHIFFVHMHIAEVQSYCKKKHL